MPLALNDAEYAAVMQAAGPVHRLQRDAFLKALAIELERHPIVGPGVVRRCPLSCIARSSECVLFSEYPPAPLSATPSPVGRAGSTPL
jgi:hypothetical protein